MVQNEVKKTSPQSSPLIPTAARKVWPYEQYYLGQRDYEHRKSGHGANYWTGAEGIYHSNMRWGPGIESEASLHENVGIWRGTQLIRLAWRPSAPNVAADLITSFAGKRFVEPLRVIFTPNLKVIGETNNALELLKQCGSEPMTAAERWHELYPKSCNDLSSRLCHVDLFDHDYYNGEILTLEENIDTSDSRTETLPSDDQEKNEEATKPIKYYAWNSNKVMIHMMKHCFTHEWQRDEGLFDLMGVVSGPRKQFKPAAQHEIDCRTLLMASYLGHITNVAQLVNERDVHPDVSDIQGNSALMYAACGDQVDVIHFLVEAGANVNCFNDSCCTALGMALLRYACTEADISASGISQALLPPSTVSPVLPLEEKAVDWNIHRNTPAPSPVSTINKSVSKTLKPAPTKKTKSAMSVKETPNNKKKTESPAPNRDSRETESLESFSEEKRLYHNINNAYITKINDLYAIPSGVSPIPYIFEVNDMLKDVDSGEDDQKKVGEKAPKKIVSKVIKDTMKPSKDMMWQSSDKDDFESIDSAEKTKCDALSRNMLTILQLLADGADPRLTNCPQPALFMATVSGNTDLIRHLISHGADVNEIYPYTFCYSALDVAMSRPLTYQNLEMIRALLECGADATHRLKYDDIDLKDPEELAIPGPTLLHVAVGKKSESETQEEIRRQMIEMLLQHNCNPTLQFKGRSALDVVLSKKIELLEIFIKCPKTNLNAVINSSNKTLLVKMFTMPFCNTISLPERLHALTNLLLYGADPLAKCQNGDETFQNLFVYAQKVLATIENPSTKQSPGSSKTDSKAKKVEKPKKEDKSTPKLGSDDIVDYKQALDLVTECARLLHIRWLQAILVAELIEIIDRFKHRQWNMILKEHKKKKCTGLWVTAARCLEIWDILKTTNKKIYKDNYVLKHLLYVVHFYNTRPMIKFKQPYMSAKDKNLIEYEVNQILCEHKTAASATPKIMSLTRPYVTPELYIKSKEKFFVCFECAMPFDEEKIVCSICKLISFCCTECIMSNIMRANCHPCSNYLMPKYFPSSDGSASPPY